MASDEPPSMRPYGRHLFICGHGTCGPAELARALEAAVRDELGERRRLRNPERVKVSIADCLGVCAGGPIAVVYPDGIWYHHLDLALARRIAREHLLGGVPVADAVFHRLYPAEASPAYAPAVRGDAGSYIEPVESSPAADAAGDEEPRGATDVTALDAAAREQRRLEARRANRRKGLVIVNTGEGKGKTTAAIGLLTRAWGRSLRTEVIQFLKHAGASYGEVRAAKRMGIPWAGSGDGWTWRSKDLEASAALARAGWERAQARLLSGELDLLVLDEFTYPLHYGWLDTDQVIAWLRENKPPLLHLVVTGRYAPAALVAYADLVTEMRTVKHPLADQGIRAQPGIEY